MSDCFVRDTFPETWMRFSQADPVDDPDNFLEVAEHLGLIELVSVDDDALENPFAYELGIEPGGMMWQLTEAGRIRYKEYYP